MAKPKQYPYWPAYSCRRDFLADKRQDAVILLAAIRRMRCGMAYLPPAVDRNAAGHMKALEEWIRNDCAPMWKKA